MNKYFHKLLCVELFVRNYVIGWIGTSIASIPLEYNNKNNPLNRNNHHFSTANIIFKDAFFAINLYGGLFPFYWGYKISEYIKSKK